MNRRYLGTLAVLVALPITISACGGGKQPEPGRAQSAPATHQSAQMVEMAVTSAGFEPAEITVKAGQPVMLMVTRKTDQTCATRIVLKDFGIDQALPLNQTVHISFTPTKAGKYRYACGMDMVSGVLVAE